MTVTQRIAIQKSGWSQPDIDGMKQVICLMRDTYLVNRALQSYLRKSVHSFTDMTDQFLRNFRSKISKWIIDPSLDFGKKDLPYLQHSTTNLANDTIILDTETKQTNFRNHLRLVLQDGGGGWNVLKLLNLEKEENPGFNFQMWFDKNNKPIGVCWITSNMRRRLLRHGKIMFLDAQKRQYNKHGWVYIGPCIRDHNNTTGTVIELLGIEESIDSYSFVLKSLFKMEPSFDKSQIKVMFADDLITESLLSNVGIASTCILRCDVFIALA